MSQMTHFIDFSPEGISKFGNEFSVISKNQPLTPKFGKLLNKVIVNSEIRDLQIAEIHIKEGLGLEDIESWTDTHAGVGILSFVTSHGIHCALRFDMMRNTFAKFGRKNLPINHIPHFLPHAAIPYAQQAQKRGAEVENPLGFISISDREGGYIFFVIVEVMTGGIKMPEDISENVAKEMARILSLTHNQGIIHHHPHGNNWILLDDTPRLVDGKGLLLAEDFPHTTCAKRVMTFDLFRKSDIAHVLHDFFWKEQLGKEKEAFINTYTSLYRDIS